MVETLLGNYAFRYLSIFSTLFATSVNSLIPPAPSSMLCRRCGLCSRRNRKGRGGNVTKTLKNRILLPSVSTLLSPIVVLPYRGGHRKVFNTAKKIGKYRNIPKIIANYRNRPFARSGHMVRNKLCWDAIFTVRLPKQRKVGLDWYILCFGTCVPA